MNKKGIIFMPLFAIFVLIILAQAYYQIFIKDVNDNYANIGLNQAEIMKAYNKGVEYELNAEHAVKYASYVAINNFTKYSGVKINCNNKWKFNSNCDPDLEKNFIEFFKEALSYYNYETKDVKIDNNFIIVNLEDFNYKNKIKSFEVEYNLPITIKQELNTDLNRLNSIKEKINNCLKEGKDLNICVNEKITNQGNIATFIIESNKNILIYTDKIETKKPDFVFSIDEKDSGVAFVSKKPF